MAIRGGCHQEFFCYYIDVQSFGDAAVEVIAGSDADPLLPIAGCIKVVHADRRVGASRCDCECVHISSTLLNPPPSDGEVCDTQVRYVAFSRTDSIAEYSNFEYSNRLDLPDKQLFEATTAEEVSPIVRPSQMLYAGDMFAESPQAAKMRSATPGPLVSAKLDISILRSGSDKSTNGCTRWCHCYCFDLSAVAASVDMLRRTGGFRLRAELRCFGPRLSLIHI